MPLDLQDRPALPQVFTSNISVDNMTWWFWIKAGIGFAIGSGLGMLCWGLITLMLLMGLGLTGWLVNSAISSPLPHATLRR